MTPVTPPNNLQAGTYSARLDRLATACLLTPNYAAGPLVARAGLKPAPSGTSGMVVTQRATPDMHVTVGAGTVYIPATSTLGGSYECHNDGSYDVTIAAAHASLPRRDLVIARVYDAIDDTGALNQFTLEAVTGTPASSPAVPATPSQSYVLAQVLVPAASASVINANITDTRVRTVALGGVLPVRTATDLPASPYPGLTIWREDTKAAQVWNGTAWLTTPAGAATAWQTPTLGAGWATGPFSGTVQAMRYRINALGCLEIVGAIHSTSASPAATAFTLPTGYRPATGQRPAAMSNRAGVFAAGILDIFVSGAVQVSPLPAASTTDIYCYADNIPLVAV